MTLEQDRLRHITWRTTLGKAYKLAHHRRRWAFKLTIAMPGLFDPIQIGSIKCDNRVFMAPMTRARATREGVPTDLMVTYYKQRATAGLIITEGTGISKVGLGWTFAPGIWNDEQVSKWKEVVKAVHDEGGKIICQLWHMGRATHSNVNDSTPVSASATTYPKQLHTYDGKKDPETAHALTVDEIKATLEDYRKAARNAIEAGFDGVEIHAANGFLIDQFLRDSSNFRTDEYGGSIENRTRLLREVAETVVDEVGAERTSVRLSPNGDSQGVIDSDPEPLFVAAAEILSKLNVSMLDLRESFQESTFFGQTTQQKLHGPIRNAFKNALLLNQQYDRDSAEEAIQNGTADAISFGRAFIPNPDLVDKMKHNKKLRVFNDMVKWWYSQGPEGYIDFPPGSD